MTDLHLLRARKAETLANLEDLAEFKDSRFPHERDLWWTAKKAADAADDEYRRAVAKTELVHGQ